MMSSKVDVEALKKEYEVALKDTQFKKLVNRLEVLDEDAMKYTSSLQNTVCELNNCSNCDGLLYCKNRLDGHVFFPTKNGRQIIFAYAPCKYQKEAQDKENNRHTREKDILNAKMSDIDVTDKKRYDVIKWLKSFYDTYDRTEAQKGLYLHGNFGCGKTYLIAALFNELAKKKIRTEIVYFPELLRDIKCDFDSYGDRLEYLEDVDLLLIDDIGAEKVTEWSRDEILGTILQKRMNNYKTTFFTSNLNISELESHLKGKSFAIDDEIKARRIIERIKQLTIDMEMIGENKRK